MQKSRAPRGPRPAELDMRGKLWLSQNYKMENESEDEIDRRNILRI